MWVLRRSHKEPCLHSSPISSGAPTLMQWSKVRAPCVCMMRSQPRSSEGSQIGRRHHEVVTTLRHVSCGAVGHPTDWQAIAQDVEQQAGVPPGCNLQYHIACIMFHLKGFHGTQVTPTHLPPSPVPSPPFARAPTTPTLGNLRLISQQCPVGTYRGRFTAVKSTPT